jgi:hypothetical protein
MVIYLLRLLIISVQYCAWTAGKHRRTMGEWLKNLIVSQHANQRCLAGLQTAPKRDVADS